MDDHRPGFYSRVIDGSDGLTPTKRSSPNVALREKDFQIGCSPHRYGSYIIQVTRKIDGRIRISRCFKSDIKKTIADLLKSLGCSGRIEWSENNEQKH